MWPFLDNNNIQINATANQSPVTFFFSPVDTGYCTSAEMCDYSCLGNQNTRVSINSFVTAHADLDKKKTPHYLEERMNGVLFKLVRNF